MGREAVEPRAARPMQGKPLIVGIETFGWGKGRWRLIARQAGVICQN